MSEERERGERDARPFGLNAITLNGSLSVILVVWQRERVNSGIGKRDN